MILHIIQPCFTDVTRNKVEFKLHATSDIQ
jgi:hypothetical protein